MKNYRLSIIVFMVLAFAKAQFLQAQQEFKGIATYQSKMTFKERKKDTAQVKDKDREMSKEMSDAITEALKTAGEAEFTLSFTKDESIYEKVIELAKPKPSTSGFSMTITGGGTTHGTSYKNLKEGIFKREDQIQGKEFLIVDELEKYDWKITGESKQIGNYTAIKATYTVKAKVLTDEEKKELEEEKEEEEESSTGLFSMMERKDKVTTAWFTPQIPVSNGPGTFQGLPGLILELQDGNTTLLCTKIEINPEKFEIKIPDTGKEIKRVDFEKLQKKKQEQMMKRFKNKRGTNVQFIRG
jgi:GLPGLI family protein